MNAFDKEELYEIEKAFDERATENARGLAQQISILTHFEKNKKVEEYISKLFEESIKSYDLFRTISAKAKNAREHEYNKTETGKNH